MAKMNSPYIAIYDAAPEVALMTRGDAAKTASFNGAAINLDTLKGHWNPSPSAPADQTLEIAVNVTALAGGSARTATITFASVIDTDAFTLNDGTKTKTFTAGTDFVTGANDTITAANAAAAINTAHTANQIGMTATSAGAVITVTQLSGTGGTITDADTTISETAFAGNDETYTLAVEVGPVGFATSVIPVSYTISKIGQYRFFLDMDTIRAVKADAAAIRIKGTLAGAAPSLTAYAWIAGC